MRHLKVLVFFVLAGLGVAFIFFLFQSWLNDLDFYRNAHRQSVVVIHAGSTIEKSSCANPIECAASWEAKIRLELGVAGSKRFVMNVFSGSRQSAEEWSSYFQSLEGKKAEFFLNENTPEYFSENRPSFPWRTLAGILVIFLTTIFPFGLCLVEYFANGSSELSPAEAASRAEHG